MAQSVITGTVLSIEDETPVVGASVKVQGTNDGAVTDMYGRFSLKNVKSGTKLVISYIGMKSRTVMARQNMRVILENDSKALDEVLVQVAYGAAKKSTLTGAVSQIDHRPGLRTGDLMVIVDRVQPEIEQRVHLGAFSKTEQPRRRAHRQKEEAGILLARAAIIQYSVIARPAEDAVLHKLSVAD